MKKNILVILSALLLFSCQEVIDVKLKDQGEPKVVIEGYITTDPGPHTIRISRTVPYFSETTFDPISGATVTITEDGTTTETLTELAPGIYRSNTQAKVDSYYELKVITGSEVYTASDRVKFCPPIDSLDYIYKEETDFSDAGFDIRMYAAEPPGEDYYRIIFYQNGVRQGGFDNFIYTDDRFVNGNYIDGIEFEMSFNYGDEIVVEMLSTSREVFKFYQSVEFQGSSGGGFDPPPANLNSTISNGGFGYFGAFDVNRDTLIIK